MALIECNECAAQVSDRAPSCIRCGAPLAVNGKPAPQAVVTIQKTAKRYKGGKLASVALIGLGVVLCMAGRGSSGLGALLVLVGFGVYVWSRFGAWWNHH